MQLKVISFKIDHYNCKMFYVTPKVTTKKIPTEDAQK